MKTKWTITIALAAVLWGGTAGAQDAYPSRPIRILVPFSAGSLVDTIARMYGEKLGARIGQPVVVENKVGSGGISASQTLLAAPFDGYTFEMVSSSHAINATLYPKLPYDTTKDMTCVALVASSPSVIITRNDLGVKTVAEFVALARQKPGSMNFGSGGVGTAAHLAGEYFRSQTKTDLVHVPYKGVSPQIQDLAGGQVVAAVADVGVPAPFVRNGRIRPIAVTGTRRAAALPDVPLAQDAVPGLVGELWVGIYGPKGVPREALEQMRAGVAKVQASADWDTFCATQGAASMKAGATELLAMTRQELEKWGPLVRASGMQID